MLLQGTAGMCVCNVLTGFFSYTDSNPWLIVTFILVFLCFFESSLGTVLWIYLSETMVDQAVGIAVALNWVVAGIVVGTLLFFVSPSVLNVYGTFFLYGALCVFIFIFILIVIPESKKKAVEKA
jgi:SP family sugar porter-like MFS transporter